MSSSVLELEKRLDDIVSLDDLDRLVSELKRNDSGVFVIGPRGGKLSPVDLAFMVCFADFSDVVCDGIVEHEMRFYESISNILRDEDPLPIAFLRKVKTAEVTRHAVTERGTTKPDSLVFISIVNRCSDEVWSFIEDELVDRSSRLNVPKINRILLELMSPNTKERFPLSVQRFMNSPTGSTVLHRAIRAAFRKWSTSMRKEQVAAAIAMLQTSPRLLIPSVLAVSSSVSDIPIGVIEGKHWRQFASVALSHADKAFETPLKVRKKSHTVTNMRAAVALHDYLKAAVMRCGEPAPPGEEHPFPIDAITLTSPEWQRDACDRVVSEACKFGACCLLDDLHSSFPEFNLKDHFSTMRKKLEGHMHSESSSASLGYLKPETIWFSFYEALVEKYGMGDCIGEHLQHMREYERSRHAHR